MTGSFEPGTDSARSLQYGHVSKLKTINCIKESKIGQAIKWMLLKKFCLNWEIRFVFTLAIKTPSNFKLNFKNY